MSFGYFVNVIGSLIRMRAESDEKSDKEVRSLNRYMHILNISDELKFKIRSHFFNKHIIDKIFDSEEEKSVLDQLTPNLKTTLKQENNITIVRKS